jgi:membrane protease YdiL (CAAX protease family)
LTPTVRLQDIFRLMIGAFAAEIAVAVSLHIFEASHFLTLILSESAGSVWWIVGYQKLSHIRGWEGIQGRFSPVGGRVILTSAMAALILIGLSVGLATILELAGIKIIDLPPQALMPKTLRELPLAMAFVVVLGPLSEELIFRGLLLDWLRQRMAVWSAALIISLLFAFLHNIGFKYGAIDWIAFVERFSLGLVASFFAARTRSLRAPFVMHATLNGCACLASIFLRGGS